MLPVIIRQMDRFALHKVFILGLQKKMAELECQTFYWLLFRTKESCVLSINFSFIPDAIVQHSYSPLLVQIYLALLIVFSEGRGVMGPQESPVFNNISYLSRKASPLLLALGLEWPFSGTRRPIHLRSTWGHHRGVSCCGVDLSDKDREENGTPSVVRLPNSFLCREQAGVIDFPQATGIFPDCVS